MLKSNVLEINIQNNDCVCDRTVLLKHSDFFKNCLKYEDEDSIISFEKCKKFIIPDVQGYKDEMIVSRFLNLFSPRYMQPNNLKEFIIDIIIRDYFIIDKKQITFAQKNSNQNSNQNSKYEYDEDDLYHFQKFVNHIPFDVLRKIFFGEQLKLLKSTIPQLSLLIDDDTEYAFDPFDPNVMSYLNENNTHLYEKIVKKCSLYGDDEKSLDLIDKNDFFELFDKLTHSFFKDKGCVVSGPFLYYTMRGKTPVKYTTLQVHTDDFEFLSLINKIDDNIIIEKYENNSFNIWIPNHGLKLKLKLTSVNDTSDFTSCGLNADCCCYDIDQGLAMCTFSYLSYLKCNKLALIHDFVYEDELVMYSSLIRINDLYSSVFFKSFMKYLTNHKLIMDDEEDYKLDNIDDLLIKSLKRNGYFYYRGMQFYKGRYEFHGDINFNTPMITSHPVSLINTKRIKLKGLYQLNQPGVITIKNQNTNKIIKRDIIFKIDKTEYKQFQEYIKKTLNIMLTSDIPEKYKTNYYELKTLKNEITNDVLGLWDPVDVCSNLIYYNNVFEMK